MQAQPALAALEQRIIAKEAANLQAFQKEILAELKTIRAALVSEPTVATLPKEQDGEDQKDKKIAQLQNENRRLSYRITHLTRNLQTALNPK